MRRLAGLGLLAYRFDPRALRRLPDRWPTSRPGSADGGDPELGFTIVGTRMGPRPEVVLDSPSPVRGAGLDAGRLVADRQRRRPALAVARLGRRRPRRSRSGSAWIDINHALSPDGKSLAFNAFPIWTVPVEGGSRPGSRPARGTTSTAGRPTAAGSPTRANRGQGLDLYSIAPRRGPAEVRLTTGPHRGRRPPSTRPTAAGSTSLSDRAGNRDIWRIPPPAPGATPGPSGSPATTARTPAPASRPTAGG